MKSDGLKVQSIMRVNTATWIAVAFVAAVFISIQFFIVQSAKKHIIRELPDVPECDAVMVLGALVYNSGTPHPLLRDRLDNAFDIYANGKAKKILVSGDHGRDDYDEVNAMKTYLINKGVPSRDIFMDHAGFNTYDSMFRARDIFGVESLIISTQEFHISRSVYIARTMGIEAYGYPCEDVYAVKSNKFRESFARVKAFWDTAIKRQPKFLGETIPISGNGDATAG
ncbi:MAG: YdcF family protein [Oscillospiraceae bacterium]|nr:YdcF family protein [Oscillospiraceae bacterium]